MTPATMLKRLAALEAKAPSKGGNWVIGLSGKLIWDPWDFPEPSEDEAAATLASLLRQMDLSPNAYGRSPTTIRRQRRSRRTL